MNTIFTPIQFEKYDWEQLISPSKFSWEYGVTPFSEVQWGIYGAIIYLLIIFGLQKIVSLYPKFFSKLPLKPFMLFHNLFLSAFSTICLVNTLIALSNKVSIQGWKSIFCYEEENPIRGPLHFWCYWYYLSKYYELIDTVFMVLKGRKLILLHLFHHAIMPISSWALLHGEQSGYSWIVNVENSFVHIFMYFYYAISLYNRKIWWKKYLTIAQITQFVSGLPLHFIIYYYFFSKSSLNGGFKRVCSGNLYGFAWTLILNFIFLQMFCSFYKKDNQKTKIQ